MLTQSACKTFTLCEHGMGFGNFFQAVAARTEKKLQETQFLAIRCVRCTPAPLVEAAATCKPTSDA